MPEHDFKCSGCGHVFSLFQRLNELTERTSCPKCGQPARKTFEFFATKGGGGVRVFKPFWHEHIDTTPIYIESKKQLLEECEKRGLFSYTIEESYNRRF